MLARLPLTFMGTKWRRQHCPSCNKTYELLALGQDLKRTSLKCQVCISAEEADTGSVLPESH